MVKYLGLLLAAVLASCASISRYHDIPSQVVSYTQDNVYQIYSYAGTGTGFWIDGRTMVTACHVVEGSNMVRVQSYTGANSTFLWVESCNTYSDIALLIKPGDKVLGVQKTKLSHTLTPIGKSIWGAGYPLGGPLTITSGNWGYKSTFGHYITAPTAGGDSGSPVIAVVNNKVRVVGMRVSIGYYEYPDLTHKDVVHAAYWPHITHAVSSSDILEFIGETE